MNWSQSHFLRVFQNIIISTGTNKKYFQFEKKDVRWSTKNYEGILYGVIDESLKLTCK